MNELEELKEQVKSMQEIIMALIILQDPLVKIKLRKAYPKLDEFLTAINSKF